MVQKQVSDLLQREMTRKEFMATLGFGAATLMGFGSIVRLLTGTHTTSATPQHGTTATGYGASVYGGRPR